MNLTKENNYNYDMPTPTIEACSTDSSYNKPGMPKPPAGYGRVIGFTDSVDGDDMGPESKDEY